MAVVVPILSTFNAAGINAASRSLSGFGGSLKKLGLQAAAAAAGVKAMGMAVDFVSESVTAARDLQRNMFALNTVFGELSPRMTKFTKDAANMGISQVDAARTATFLGSVLKQAGFSMADTATETEKLTVLAQDLATTYGYDVSEALTAMTALFRGEYDPIEKFGVALKQDEVNALLAAKQLGNLTGQAKLNAQQQVRLEQLYKRSADAQGAFTAQSRTLYGVQGRLNATFENLKSTLGNELLPAMAQFGEALIPIVNDNGPKLRNFFVAIGNTVDALVPLLAPLGRILGDLVGAVGSLLNAFVPLIEYLANVAAVVLEDLADLFESLGRGIDDLFGIFNNLFQLSNDPLGSSMTDWILQQMYGFMKLSPILKEVYKIWMTLLGKNESKSSTADQARQNREAGQARNFTNERTDFSSPDDTSTTGDTKKKATDFVKEFYASMADEVAKQKASLKLKSLGASDALIESIVGSGEGWQKVYKNIIAGGQASVMKVQALFATTKDGIAEITKAREDAAAVAKKLQEEAEAAYLEEKAAYEKRIELINEFKDALSGIVATLKPLAFIEREVGRFESAIVDSFSSIKDEILNGLADGVLTADAAKNLQVYADKESAVLAKLGKQRDALKTKYDLASSLIEETRSAVMAYADITAMLDKQTTMVTDTVQTMVNGVRLTRTSTREQIISGNNLVESFKGILEKTVAFGKSLKQLRELGLDKNLYKQIVDSGLEAGSATAEAIIKGGAGTVTELNDLFGQLDKAGAEIAQTSATVMFNNGKDMVGGLLEGLKAQDDLLVETAESMATTFAKAFNAMLGTAISMPNAPVMPSVSAPVVSSGAQMFDLSNRPSPTASPESYARWLSGVGGIDPVRSPESYNRANNPTYNITVNAGAITDKASLPQIIVDALGQYTRQSGTAGLTRLLGV